VRADRCQPYRQLLKKIRRPRTLRLAASMTRSFGSAVKVYIKSVSANAALSARSANAISGSIIQNAGEVGAGVRILGAEGRAECVDLVSASQ
jgi:hypothetical protein